MLVLTRRRNEVIEIGTDIKIMIVGIHGEKVLVGVDAPKAIPVHRHEVAEAIRREKESDAK